MQIFSSSYLWAFAVGNLAAAKSSSITQNFNVYIVMNLFFLKTMSRLITRVAVLHKFR